MTTRIVPHIPVTRAREIYLTTTSAKSIISAQKKLLSGRFVALALLLPILLLALAACGRVSTPEGWSGGAIHGDTLYIGTREGDVRALDTQSGETRWRTALGIDDDDRAFRSVYGTPAIHDDRLYVGGYDGRLYVLGLHDGDRLDHKATTDNASIVGSPTIASDVVIVGSDNGTVYAFTQQDLQRRWTFTTGNKVWSSPVVVHNTVYVTSLDKNLYALNLDDGTEIWRFPTNGAIASTPAVDGGIVYVGSFDGVFYAVDAASGNQIWKFEGAQNWYWGAPLVHDNLVFAPSLDGKLYALDKLTGALRWSLTTEDPIVGSPVVVFDMMIVVGSDDGRLHIARISDGNPVDSCNMNTPIRSALVQKDGTIFLGAHDKSIRALKIKSNGNPDEEWVYLPDEENPVARGRVEDC